MALNAASSLDEFWTENEYVKNCLVTTGAKMAGKMPKFVFVLERMVRSDNSAVIHEATSDRRLSEPGRAYL